MVDDAALLSAVGDRMAAAGRSNGYPTEALIAQPERRVGIAPDFFIFSFVTL